MTALRKTTARCSSRQPHEAEPQVTIKVPSAHHARLKGLASLRKCSVQEIVRGFIAKGLEQ